MKKTQMRKLEETSWLAQAIADRMAVEFRKNGPSSRWRNLNTFKVIVSEADNKDNDEIYYETIKGTRRIIICNIPSLTLKHGTDFDREGMQSQLRGLAENYKDDDGMYIVSVLTTHDLNSATIEDIEELMYQMAHK